MNASAELREIKVFLAVARRLSFARAADELGITGSRVSQTIGTLELRLGVKLFERTSRRVALTPAGAQLLERLAPAYGELQAALEDVAAQATGAAAALRLGMYNRTVGGPHMIEIIERFRSEHPTYSVVYVDTGPRNYIEVLRSGEVDMLATRLPVSDPDLTVGPVLTREPHVMLAGRSHRLAGRATVSHEDLADETVTDIAAFPREMMDTFFPPVTRTGKRIKRIETPSWEQLLVRVATGEILHVTVPSFLDYFSHPGVVAVPVSDLGVSETALVWLTADHRAVIQEFVKVAQSVLASAR